MTLLEHSAASAQTGVLGHNISLVSEKTFLVLMAIRTVYKGITLYPMSGGILGLFLTLEVTYASPNWS